MLRKMILPLFAAVIAVSAAMASSAPFAQMGWYRNSSGVGVQATITTPPGNTPVCSTSATAHQCIIVVDDTSHNAFDSKADAEGLVTSGLLKYSN